MSLQDNLQKELNDKIKENTENFEKQTYDLLKSGTAFTNPLGDKISTAKEAMSGIDVNDLQTKINRVTDKLGIDAVEITDIQDIVDKANSGISKLEEFKSHTDELSGVTVNGNRSLTNIVKVVSALETDVGQACSPKFSEAFGSLLDNDLFDKLKEHAEEVSDWFDWFDDDENTDGLLSASTMEKINAVRDKINHAKTLLDTLESKIDDSMIKDREAFDSAVNELIQKSIAKYMPSLLENKCTSAILSKVQSPQLTKAIDEYAKKKGN